MCFAVVFFYTIRCTWGFFFFFLSPLVFILLASPHSHSYPLSVWISCLVCSLLPLKTHLYFLIPPTILVLFSLTLRSHQTPRRFPSLPSQSYRSSFSSFSFYHLILTSVFTYFLSSCSYCQPRHLNPMLPPLHSALAPHYNLLLLWAGISCTRFNLPLCTSIYSCLCASHFPKYVDPCSLSSLNKINTNLPFCITLRPIRVFTIFTLTRFRLSQHTCLHLSSVFDHKPFLVISTGVLLTVIINLGVHCWQSLLSSSASFGISSTSHAVHDTLSSL